MNHDDTGPPQPPGSELDLRAVVVHNLGNVLNSISVAVGALAAADPSEPLGRLEQLAERLSTSPGEAPLPSIARYLKLTAAALSEQHRTRADELAALRQRVEHMRRVLRSASNLAGATDAEPTDLAALVALAVDFSSVAVGTVPIAVQVAVAVPDLVVLRRDAVLQILVNLLRNARHAVLASERADRLVQIRASRPEAGRLVLSVADNGVGVRPEHRARLFTPHFTTRADGQGIGLASSRALAQSMNGDLTCSSDGPDRGATFLLTLPWHTAAP